MLNIKAKDIMTKKVKTLGDNATLREAAEQMVWNKVSGLPVVNDKGILVGIITEADLMSENKRQAAIPRMALYGLYVIPAEVLEKSYHEGFSLKVKDVMTKKVITASPEAYVEELAEIMVHKGINRIPIVEEGKLVGVVSRNDIIKSMSRSD